MKQFIISLKPFRFVVSIALFSLTVVGPNLSEAKLNGPTLIDKMIEFIQSQKSESKKQERTDQLQVRIGKLPEFSDLFKARETSYQLARSDVRKFLKSIFASSNIAKYAKQDSTLMEKVELLNLVREIYVQQYGIDALIRSEFSQSLFLDMTKMNHDLADVRNNLIIADLAVLSNPEAQRQYDEAVAQLRAEYNSYVQFIANDADLVKDFYRSEFEDFKNLRVSKTKLGVISCQRLFD